MTPEFYAVRWGHGGRKPWFAAMVRVNDHPKWGSVLPFFIDRNGNWCNVAHEHETITGRRFRSERAALEAAKLAGVPMALVSA